MRDLITKLGEKEMTKLTKEQEKELEQIALEIEAEAIQMKLDYEDNPPPSEETGSLIYVHQNSEFLENEEEE